MTRTSCVRSSRRRSTGCWTPRSRSTCRRDAYERSEARTGYRNGYRSRQLETRVGTLTLSVPTDREGSCRTELFERYQRSEKALVAGLMELAAGGRPRGREHEEGQGHHRGVVRHGVQQEHREPLGGGVWIAIWPLGGSGAWRSPTPT